MKNKLTGIERQDAFIKKFQSEPLRCPLCNGTHTKNELDTLYKNESDFHCPTTQKPIHYGIGFFDGVQTLSAVR
jgi:hypothetical protein